MFIFSVRLGVAFLAAALCLAARPADAQSQPMSYWVPGWLGFGGNLSAGQGANTGGNGVGYSSSEMGGLSAARYHFPNGWFVGSERGSLGFGMNGINQPGAFGSAYAEGAQFGYTLKNSPITVYGGLDTLKYDSGIPNAFSSLNAMTGTVTGGYRLHTGVEFNPSSNLSLSLGAGVTQQSGRVDTELQSTPLSHDSQFGLVSGRR
jgi:hypothetical protein